MKSIALSILSPFNIQLVFGMFLLIYVFQAQAIYKINKGISCRKMQGPGTSIF